MNFDLPEHNHIDGKILRFKSLQTLYGIDKNGKVKEWNISVVENEDNTCTIRKIHGYQDGKKQVQDKLIKCGKNIGRANETSIFEQACSEAQSVWTKKTDQNYFTEVPNESTMMTRRLLPMLAVPFKKQSHRVEYPCWVQPKLNGVRCLAKVDSTHSDNDTVDYTSRTGKKWDFFEHLDPYILDYVKPGMILDGEIFNRNMTFQQITSYVKKLYHETEQLQYWIYDLAIPAIPYKERMYMLDNMIPDDHPFLVKVPTHLVTHVDYIKEFHKAYTDEGYEGLIIRNAKGLYEFDYRSKDLQKFKIQIDREYEIVGGNEGTGVLEECCIFECITDKGLVFGVTPEGPIELKKQYWKELPSLIGKMLTVKFDEYTDDGKPRNPVGVAVRDYE